MTSTGENSSSPIDGIYGKGSIFESSDIAFLANSLLFFFLGFIAGSSTLDRNDPFPMEGNGTTKFIGGTGINKFDFHTIKAANVANSKVSC